MSALPQTDVRQPVRWGLALLVAGFGGFLAWAALAPLDEAVPASAVVSVDSKRKRVDHLHGGLVEKMLVREGEKVREGQELLVLNEAQSRAAVNASLAQWQAAKAAEARLLAERQGLKSVAFPPELSAAAAMSAQEELFRSRRAALEGDLRMIRESARGLEEQLRALEQMRAGRETQVRLRKEQLESFRKLHAQGFVSRNHLLEQERQLAETQAKQSEDLANLAGIKARLADFRIRASQRETEYRREVETQLAEVQKETAALGEKLAAERDTHARLVIRAPVSGTVVDLTAYAAGGVVKPGERIMDIVPADEAMVVEARVAPQYIDRMRPGLPVDLHFDAYMSRAERPLVGGTVTVVSADALTDAKSGESYYAIRVSVPVESPAARLELLPGMQATAMIKTGERSLLVYLARPLLRRFTSALAER